MDFGFSEEQTAIRDLARDILAREVTQERLKAVEATPDRIDRALWKTLAEANLLGIAVPEAQGGMGHGILELCVLLEELGRAVAPVPAVPALVLGGLPIARFGTEAQRERWLRPLAAGDALLAAALPPAGGFAARARRLGDDFVLDGALGLVPAAGRAARVLVPAAIDAEPAATRGPDVGVFLVDPNDAGVELAASRTSTREPLFAMTLAGLRLGADDALGGSAADGARIAAWLRDCALAALCATQVGVSERALEITTGHVRERVQFGVPIGSFQAVQHRAADCWIDLQAMRWTAWRAAWRIASDGDAERDAAVAKFWAAAGGSRIANAAQHLHGGLGVDVDYPIHRHFLWSKSLELALGGATPTLARLGQHLATRPLRPELA